MSGLTPGGDEPIGNTISVISRANDKYEESESKYVPVDSYQINQLPRDIFTKENLEKIRNNDVETIEKLLPKLIAADLDHSDCIL